MHTRRAILGNQVARTYSYNTLLQPSEMKDMVSGQPLLDHNLTWGTNGANNGTLKNQSLAYSGTGLSSTLTFNPTYTYDTANRLASAGESTGSGSWSEAFGYDRYGNVWLTSSSGIPAQPLMPNAQAAYNSTNNRLANGQYDASGNQQAFSTYVLTYDAENRQVKVTDNTSGNVTTYSYDGTGQRVMKVAGSVTTVYVHDVFGNLAAEYTTGALPQQPCTTCYRSWDHLGSTRMVTDAGGAVVARHDYLPFGVEIPGGSAGRTNLWGTNDNVTQKFTGQERDQETGFDFFQARYFGAAQARFNSPDPFNAGADLANPQSWNAYAYVSNNPLAFVDPTGTCSMGSDGAAHDDQPGDCGGGSVTVSGGPPDEVPIDPCLDCGYIPGSGGQGSHHEQPPLPSPFRFVVFTTATHPKTGILTTIGQKFCSAIPDARTISVDVGAGGLGSVHGSVTATLDYKTGLTSFSASGGFLGGWNGVLSASVSTGYVYGSSDTNTSTNYSVGSAISGYYSKSGSAREVGVSTGWGLLGKYSLGVGKYQSTASVGNVPGLMLPSDNLLGLLKQVCQ